MHAKASGNSCQKTLSSRPQASVAKCQFWGRKPLRGRGQMGSGCLQTHVPSARESTVSMEETGWELSFCRPCPGLALLPPATELSLSSFSGASSPPWSLFSQCSGSTRMAPGE